MQGCGTVFELLPNSDGTWSESLIFVGSGDTFFPDTSVLLDRRGNVYGIIDCFGIDCVYSGAFELTRGSDGMWTDFYSTFSQGFPACLYGGCGVMLDRTGNFYGTMPAFGGGAGAVFSLDRLSVMLWYELTIYYFMGGNDGNNPSVGLAFDARGDIYGTTNSGGASGAGTVFELTPNQVGQGWTETVLYSFQGGSDGGYPIAGLVIDAAGSLYGTTSRGGSGGSGTVFKLTRNGGGSWTESVLYSFQGGGDASAPNSVLTFDATGDLYGTAAGGAHGHGAVFKLTPSAGGQWTESVTHSFTGGLDGDTPSGGVILDNAGNLFGTTQWGVRPVQAGRGAHFWVAVLSMRSRRKLAHPTLWDSEHKDQ